MALAVFVNFVSLFVFVFEILILIRVIMSWISPDPKGGFGGLMIDLTEPVLAPIRKIVPSSQSFDFSPLIAFVLLELLNQLASKLQS